MRLHQEERHGRRFELERDVYFAGNTPQGTIYDIVLDPARGDSYRCAICGQGHIFYPTEPPYGTPARNAFLRQTNPQLRALLAGAPAADHDEITEAFDRRELGQLLLSGSATRRRRKGVVQRRPDYARRLERFRGYLLENLSTMGSVERVAESLADLHERDRAEYERVVGERRYYSAQTFMQYGWACTTPAERKRAKLRRGPP
jgi:hypothetical protein